MGQSGKEKGRHLQERETCFNMSNRNNKHLKIISKEEVAICVCLGMPLVTWQKSATQRLGDMLQQSFILQPVITVPNRGFCLGKGKRTLPQPTRNNAISCAAECKMAVNYSYSYKLSTDLLKL